MSIIKQEKLVGIELLRFFSAFAVLAWHYGHFGTGLGNMAAFHRSEQPFFNVLSFFYLYGYQGVQVFWCISGFIFFYKYYARLSERKVSFGSFAINRFSRLYPLHFATLLLIALTQPLFYAINDYYFIYSNNDIKHFILNVFSLATGDLKMATALTAPYGLYP